MILNDYFLAPSEITKQAKDKRTDRPNSKNEYDARLAPSPERYSSRQCHQKIESDINDLEEPPNYPALIMPSANYSHALPPDLLGTNPRIQSTLRKSGQRAPHWSLIL